MCQCGHFSLISSINAKIWRGRSDRRMNYVCSAVSFNWKWHFNKLVSRQCSLYGHYAYEYEYEYEYLISSPIINANDDRSALRLVLIWSTAAHQHLNLAFSFLFLCFNFFPFFTIFFFVFLLSMRSCWIADRVAKGRVNASIQLSVEKFNLIENVSRCFYSLWEFPLGDRRREEACSTC